MNGLTLWLLLTVIPAPDGVTYKAAALESREECEMYGELWKQNVRLVDASLLAQFFCVPFQAAASRQEYKAA